MSLKEKKALLVGIGNWGEVLANILIKKGYKNCTNLKSITFTSSKLTDISALKGCTAEFIKYLSNSMLASMISFSNDMAMLAEKMRKIDIKKSFDAIKKDKRWYGKPSEMKNYFHPGLGYGGYCLPKDIKSLKNISKKYSNHGLLEKIDNINETN